MMGMFSSTSPNHTETCVTVTLYYRHKYEGNIMLAKAFIANMTNPDILMTMLGDLAKGFDYYKDTPGAYIKIIHGHKFVNIINEKLINNAEDLGLWEYNFLTKKY